MRVAVGVLAAGTVALAAPAVAQAAAITGPGTSVTFTGTGGDFVTGDQDWSYDPSSAVISATVSSDSNTVEVGIDGNTTWTLVFAAPQGQALTAGTVYDNATRWPFQSPTGPGFTLSGDGRGCNQSDGSFTVKSATFGPHGWIQSFDATFVQHCENSTTSEATGEVVLDNGPAPADLSSTVTTDATASVSHISGQATITGTVTCNRDATIGMSGTLSQRLNRTTLVTGSWSIGGIACTTAPATWSVTVKPNGSIPFGAGKAEVDGTWSSFDPVFQVNVNGSFSQDTTLRGDNS